MQKTRSEGPDTLAVTVMAPPGSTVALSGTYWASYSLQGENDLSLVKVKLLKIYHCLVK